MERKMVALCAGVIPCQVWTEDARHVDLVFKLSGLLFLI